MQLVDLALSKPPAERESFLREGCLGDSDLFRAAWHYVEWEERMQGFLVKPLIEPPSPDLPAVVAGRFQVVGRLGAGAFGDVYRVIDDAAGSSHLALKVLRSLDPVALQYFKREFRSLAGVNHRNIVALHELIAHADRWMFSMEFVDGVDLLQYLHSRRNSDRDAALRSCITQLAEGLRALHERNLLHRDLKPSNVLVTGAGRVVLLDFGLVRGFGEDTHSGGTFAGTPNYMSPEQAAGAPLGEPSDWYAVGVMLYQVLTGRLPFVYESYDALRRKQFERPVPPVEVDGTVPGELNELCLKLLDPDPLQRAGYADLIRALTSDRDVPAPESATGSLFVGRDEPLRRLDEAYALAVNHPVLVHLRGPSGIGKTALLHELMLRLDNEPDALVFASRCYEGESVPYKAIDDLIDHIADHLRRLPRDRVEQFLPRNFAALVKMFPILAPFQSSHPARTAMLEPADLRTRAFAALRELLGRFSEHHRVTLLVDDLQWGDADGCAALDDLLSASDSPAILVVLSYRSEDLDASPCLAAFRDAPRQSSSRTTIVIDLERLEGADAAEYARSLLAGPGNPEIVQHVVEQSGGNPFLVHEMVRWINARGAGPVLLQPFSLADVVRSRVNGLAAESRRLLELVAVAGQPTGLSILQTAAGIRNVLAARDELVAARLIRLRAVRGQDEVEVYHDRIRATITGGLDAAALVLCHREIAAGLEAAAVSDPERIAVHYEKALEPEPCARYALQAARRAVKVLAFHKATAFFEMALATQTLEAADRWAVHRECADALAHAGRGPEAAEHYLAASTGVPIDEQLECNLLAAEQLLFTGHIDRGLAIFAMVLGQVGLTLPKTPAAIAGNLLLRRGQLKIRGFRWRETAAAAVPRNVLLKIDTCASVAIGLSLVDIARGAALQSMTMLLALRAGEPRRIARALAMEAAYRSTVGVKARSRVESLLALARELAERNEDQRAIGLTAVMGAACAWNSGHWEECYLRARAAREALQERHERVVWERDTASIFEVDGLRWMGRWSVMKAILPELLEDARVRGDLYAQAILQMHGGSCAALANDDPERARAGLAILNRWSNTGFHVEHLVEMHNRIEVALYLGNGAEALALTRERWPALRQSLLLRVQSFRIQMRCLRARTTLGAALHETSTGVRQDLLRFAIRDGRAIEREGAVWGRALAELIEGGVESIAGRRRQAIGAFQRAAASAGSAGMFLHAAAARRSQGSLMGGDAGRELVGAADRDLGSEGIANPERLSALIAPGVPPTL
jgi:CheY-like chemotaxis protein